MAEIPGPIDLESPGDTLTIVARAETPPPPARRPRVPVPLAAEDMPFRTIIPAPDPVAEAYRQYFEENSPGVILKRETLRELGRDAQGNPLPVPSIIPPPGQEGAASEEAATPETAGTMQEAQRQLAFPAERIESEEGARKRELGQQRGQVAGYELPLLSPMIRAADRGFQQALINIGETIDDFASLFTEQPTTVMGSTAKAIFELPVPKATGKVFGMEVPGVSSVGRGADALVENLSQFVTAFAGYYAMSGVAGVAGAAPKTADWLATLAASYSAFSPENPNITNLLRDLAPSLKGPILDFLATDAPPAGTPDAAQQRLMERLGTMVTEGGMKLVADGLIGAISIIRGSNQVKRLGPGQPRPQLAQQFDTDVTSVGSTARAAVLQADVSTPEGIEAAIQQVIARHGVDPATARQAVQGAVGSPGQVALGLVEKHVGDLLQPETFNTAVEQMQRLTNVSRQEAGQILLDTYGHAFGTPGFFQPRLTRPTGAAPRQLPEGTPVVSPVEPPPSPAAPAIALPERFAQEEGLREATALALQYSDLLQTRGGRDRMVRQLVAETGVDRTEANRLLGRAEELLEDYRPSLPVPAQATTKMPERFATQDAPTRASQIVLREGDALNKSEALEQARQRLVRETGVTAEEADRLLGEGMAKIRALLQGASPDDLPGGKEELADILKELRREAPPESLSYLGEEGSAQTALIIGMARAGVGGFVGGLVGDTPEERIQNALIGAGLGSLASPALIRRLTQRLPKNTADEEITQVAQTIRRETLGKTVGERATDLMQGAQDTARVMAKNVLARAGKVAAELHGMETETLEGRAQQMQAIRSSAQAANQVPTGVVRDINYNKIVTTDDIKRTLQAMSETLEPEITAARKLGTSQEETAKLASQMGMTVEDLLARGDGQFIDSRLAYASQVMLVDSATELDRLATLVQGGNQEVMTDFLKQFVLHGEIQKSAAAIRSEAGRTLGILRATRTGDLEYYDTIQQALGKMQVPGSGEGVTAQRLAEMVTSLKTPQALNRFVDQATTPTKTQAFIEAYVNGLLSGPQTHVSQLVANALTTVWAIPENVLTVANAKLLREDASFAETYHLLYGMLEGFKDTFSLAAKAFKGEGTFGTVGAAAEVHRPAITAETFQLARTSPMGRAVELLGNVIRTPSRALDAVDEVFKAANYRGMLHLEASRASMAVPPAERAAFITEFVNNPPASVLEKAKDFAFYQTMQQSLGRGDVPFARMGQAAGDIQRFANRHPLAKMIVPFVRTPTNILRYTMERNPALALTSREVRSSLAKGGLEAAETMAKIELGTAAIATVAYLASQGYITGPGSRHPNLQANLKAKGFIPWAIRLPGTDTFVELDRTDPVGNFLIQGATLSQLSGAAGEDQLSEAIVAVTLGFMKAYKDKSFLTGFSNVVDLLSGRGETSMDAMKGPMKAASRFATGFMPGAVRQLSRAIDPEVREAQGILEALMAVTPGVSATLPPSRNNLAEPVLYGHGNAEGVIASTYRFLSPYPIREVEQSPANDLLLQNQLDLDKPIRSIEGVPLTNEEYDTYLTLARDGLVLGGKTFRQQLETWASDPKFRALPAGPEGAQGLKIRARAMQYQDLARKIILTPSRPEFQADLYKRVQAERQKTRGQRLGSVSPDPQEPGLRQATDALRIGVQ